MDKVGIMVMMGIISYMIMRELQLSAEPALLGTARSPKSPHAYLQTDQNTTNKKKRGPARYGIHEESKRRFLNLQQKLNSGSTADVRIPAPHFADVFATDNEIPEQAPVPTGRDTYNTDTLAPQARNMVLGHNLNLIGEDGDAPGMAPYMPKREIVNDDPQPQDTTEILLSEELLKHRHFEPSHNNKPFVTPVAKLNARTNQTIDPMWRPIDANDSRWDAVLQRQDNLGTFRQQNPSTAIALGLYNPQRPLEPENLDIPNKAGLATTTPSGAATALTATIAAPTSTRVEYGGTFTYGGKTYTVYNALP